MKISGYLFKISSIIHYLIKYLIIGLLFLVMIVSFGGFDKFPEQGMSSVRS